MSFAVSTVFGYIQTLDHWTKWSAERESKRKSTASSSTLNDAAVRPNDDTVDTPKESTSTETADEDSGSKNEEETKRQILIDGLPTDFFGAAMKHKKRRRCETVCDFW